LDHREILDRLAQSYCEILGDNFVGLYVHGSIAMGCFNPVKSDIDFVCVVYDEPTDGQKIHILEKTVEMERFAPEKGLEMHILRLWDCRRPSHPCPFSLHYSPTHRQAFLADPQGYVGYMKGVDPDLGGHLTILHACGLCWKGMPVSQVFAPVPKEMYLESILEDVLSECGDEIYRICNLCRVWGYLAEGLVLSKKSGAEWALGQDDCPENEVRAALRCYLTGSDWSGGDSAGEACAILRAKIFSLLPEEIKKRYN